MAYKPPPGMWISRFQLKGGRTRAVLGWKDPTGVRQRKEFSAKDAALLDERLEAFVSSLAVPEEVFEYNPIDGRQSAVAEERAPYVSSHRDLRVYQRALSLAQQVKELVESFPSSERFGLSDQFLRSSRSVCANLAEAWRKRRYRGSFVSKLSDVEGECAETQVWAEIAWLNGYCSEDGFLTLFAAYESLIQSIVGMISHADQWTTLPKPR